MTSKQQVTKDVAPQNVEAETQNEIEEILDEVEQLRRELNESPTETASSEVTDEDLMKDFEESFGKGSDTTESDEGGMESTLSELKEDPSVKTLLDQTLEDQAERTRESTSQEETGMSQETGRDEETSPSLTMTLTGSMTLKLKYDFGGQEVTVGFSDDFLKVELADGTEFKIPVGQKKKLRRVA